MQQMNLDRAIGMVPTDWAPIHCWISLHLEDSLQTPQRNGSSPTVRMDQRHLAAFCSNWEMTMAEMVVVHAGLLLAEATVIAAETITPVIRIMARTVLDGLGGAPSRAAQKSCAAASRLSEDLDKRLQNPLVAEALDKAVQKSRAAASCLDEALDERLQNSSADLDEALRSRRAATETLERALGETPRSKRAATEARRGRRGAAAALEEAPWSRRAAEASDRAPWSRPAARALGKTLRSWHWTRRWRLCGAAEASDGAPRSRREAASALNKTLGEASLESTRFLSGTDGRTGTKPLAGKACFPSGTDRTIRSIRTIVPLAGMREVSTCFPSGTDRSIGTNIGPLAGMM